MAVHKRGDVWHVRFRYFDPDTQEHRRFSRSCGAGITRAAALELEAQWRLEALRPTRKDEAPKKKRAAFSGFAAHWLRTHGPRLKPSTRRSYHQICRLYLVPHFGDRYLREIGPELVAELQAGMAANRSPKTVRNALGALSCLFHHAVRWGYADANPVDGIDHLPRAPTRIRWYDRLTGQRFLEVCRRERPAWHALFATALKTGLRQGELVALEWHDLELGDHPRVHVRRAVVEGNVGTPKNGRERVVPLPSDLVAILREHPRTLGTDLVFPSPTGDHLPPATILKRLRRVQRLAKLEEVTFHDLRHSYASQLATAGVPLAAIQAYLGHSDIQTTMRYAHLCPVAAEGFVERLVVPRHATGSSAP
ncbi:MAG: site-specific integrase [Alphaproteobacteria bacterium]|nr:site-specific integrase [Alphaproteobacteria bacterium]